MTTQTKQKKDFVSHVRARVRVDHHAAGSSILSFVTTPSIDTAELLSPPSTPIVPSFLYAYVSFKNSKNSYKMCPPPRNCTVLYQTKNLQSILALKKAAALFFPANLSLLSIYKMQNVTLILPCAPRRLQSSTRHLSILDLPFNKENCDLWLLSQELHRTSLLILLMICIRFLQLSLVLDPSNLHSRCPFKSSAHLSSNIVSWCNRTCNICTELKHPSA